LVNLTTIKFVKYVLISVIIFKLIINYSSLKLHRRWMV